MGDAPKSHRPLLALVAVVAVATAWSAWRPHDYATWFFELMIGFAGVAALLATYRRFRFSSLVYGAVAVHFTILAVGAKYTYADMPLFNQLRDAWRLSRNHFDRVGHFFQGFTPALLCRELLVRTSRIGRSRWVIVFCIAAPLAFSAFYEILEVWWVMLFYPTSGPEWLGMQGDPWDAQWDMTSALAGALVATFVFSWWHWRSMRKVAPEEISA